MITFDAMKSKLKELVKEDKAKAWLDNYDNVTFTEDDDLELAAATKEQADILMTSLITGHPLGKIDKNIVLSWQKVLEACGEEIRLASTWVTKVTEKTKILSDTKVKTVTEKVFKAQKN